MIRVYGVKANKFYMYVYFPLISEMYTFVKTIYQSLILSELRR